MTRSRTAALVLCVCLTARAPEAQQAASAGAATCTASALGSFVAQARSGTARYQDQDAAIADGYRVVGPDFPGMGEHWLNVGILLAHQFDPAHPAILQYATVRGEPRLVGVVYALALLSNETPPEFPPCHGWHDHIGSVDDESLFDQQPSGHHGTGSRVAMLHAWVWLDNPDGLFASDNWVLPFIRVARVPPPALAGQTSAARALSLASGGAEYQAGVLRHVGLPDAADSTAIDAALAVAQDNVERLLRERDSSSLNTSDVAALSAIWRRMWSTIDAGVRSNVRERLRSLRDR